jgi:hypothetical protein
MARGPHDSGERREAEALEQVMARLRSQFPELPAETIEASVLGRYQELDGSKIRDFVPVLVERAAKRELDERRSSPGHRA